MQCNRKKAGFRKWKSPPLGSCYTASYSSLSSERESVVFHLRGRKIIYLPTFCVLEKNTNITDFILEKLDGRGSVYHSIIHIENPTRYNSVSKFYFIII